MKRDVSALAGRRRLSCRCLAADLGVWWVAALVTTAIVAGGLVAPAAARPGIAEQAFVPARAPAHLRQAQLDAIGAAFADSLANDVAIDRRDLAMWLRYQGASLGRLLQATGVDPARVIENARDHAADVGGPFVAWPDDGSDPAAPEVDLDGLVDQVFATLPLALPVVDAHRFTSGFGKRRDPFRGRLAFHRGIDLAAPRGTPIHAPAAGEVVRAGRLGGFGNVVEIDHGNGVVTRYAHLHAYHVRHGDRVTPGQRLGLMGRSGRTTGVHLHYEVIVDGRHVDPARFLAIGRQLQQQAG